jgi:hypothetical protein
MVHQTRVTWLLSLVLLSTVVGACTGPRAVMTSPSTAVGIADFKTVAGVWEGLLRGLSGSQSQEDWILLKIGEDGTYSFASFRQIGVFHGSGTLQLSAGQLRLEGPEGGRATFTLYQEDSRRLLKADGLTSDGRSLTADLTPQTVSR